MTISELKTIIANLPDDASVTLSSYNRGIYTNKDLIKVTMIGDYLCVLRDYNITRTVETVSLDGIDYEVTR